jgi:outer membrane protein assembly factor BamB
VNNNFGGIDAGDCFSSPLVVNGKVYVGSGEGERDVFGFVFCLDANTGNVVWLFCTNQFNLASDNNPNVIPASAAVSNPLPSWA